MCATRVGIILGSAFSLFGCGLYVPEIQEFPGTSVDGQLLVQAIVRSVHCEVRNAITYVLDQDRKLAPLNGGFRSAQWLENWGAELTLTLQIEEKTLLNPTAAWVPHTALTSLFTLSGGLNASSDATRIDKLNFYYTVKELSHEGTCAPDPDPPLGSLLIQSDLKLREWLLSQTMGFGTGEVNYPINVNGPFKQNVLSHEVKFEVISGGNINPAWKLVESTVGQSGTLLTASRDRTHDFLITFGPIDPSQKGTLISAAANAHLASQIGLAVSNNARNFSPR
jgi:hypothetical protein